MCLISIVHFLVIIHFFSGIIGFIRECRFFSLGFRVRKYELFGGLIAYVDGILRFVIGMCGFVFSFIVFIVSSGRAISIILGEVRVKEYLDAFSNFSSISSHIVVEVMNILVRVHLYHFVT